MRCEEARALMLDARRGRADDAELREHLASCEACRHEDAADAELSRALTRLPRPASHLRDELERAHLQSPRRGWILLLVAAAIAVALLLLARPRSEPMITEAVNDHLRVVQAEHPLEIASGGIHQVKPWFTGKLDFAPIVRFEGDEEFPLRGGEVAYFLDRKAAAFVFGRRLHTVTLFVFPSHDLPWPRANATAGARPATAQGDRGFNALLWRDGDLGYALVSDVDPRDLALLAAKL